MHNIQEGVPTYVYWGSKSRVFSFLSFKSPARFDLTTHSSAGGDDTTRPRRSTYYLLQTMLMITMANSKSMMALKMKRSKIFAEKNGGEKKRVVR
jgi:hypothetical protein